MKRNGVPSADVLKDKVEFVEMRSLLGEVMSFAQQVSSTLLSVTLLVALLVPLIVSLLVSLEVLLSLLPPAASVGKLNMYSPASDEQHMAAVSQ